VSRRPPPPFLAAELAGREWITPRLVRVTLEGPALRRLEVTQPASSVRVLIPGAGRDGLEIPEWDGNRFHLRDGTRPTLRTLTPRADAPGRIRLDVVVHGRGAAATWAATAPLGSPAAVSGPARGWTVAPDAEALVIGGDETAYCALTQILEATPAATAVTVWLETGAPDADPPLPGRPGGTVHRLVADPSAPGRRLAEQLGRVELPASAYLWAAGEAAAMQTVRQELFQVRGVPRDRATLRGYWKHGRASEDDPAG
jgi:NADPH-dependent ferric siderophore reductase